MDGYLAKSN